MISEKPTDKLEILTLTTQGEIHNGCEISMFLYQTQCKVEQSGAAVEQDGDQGGGCGEEEAHVPAHHHPQRLQNLQNNDGKNSLRTSKYELPPWVLHKLVSPITHLQLALLMLHVNLKHAKSSPTLPACTYRQQSLNVLLQEGGDVLPVQDVSQPAVLSMRRHLVAGPPSGVGHVLQHAWHI